MLTGGFILSTDSSLQFAAVNRENMKDIFSLDRVVWAIHNVALYRFLIAIHFNIFPWFPLLIILALDPLEIQNSQSMQSRI